MKKALILLTLILVSLPAMPQGKKYQKGMLKAIKKMDQASDLSGLKECAATFEAFGEVNPTEWLPSYYASLALINASFEQSDDESKDKLLERASKAIGYSLKLAPKESELHVLEAFYYIGIMSIDPEIRGPEYFEEALYSLEKAKELDSKNPRGAFLQAMMALNMPDFLGGGPEAAKPLFLEAEKLFSEFENENPLWPSWGVEDVKAELEKLKDI
jgi:tetratricopeptide (TPR) repeat protein